ncbi:hypothetical protein L226DRAFT_311465 [Lentinus tigrinus ALCF2SS1-7]|uniref:uncharacterized protein n=1 Tax=Lentinus tigrinus ALCF2SS1-7 TaxID=1328758 RepID=UPI0011660C0A|nr:hypothetical protein L226DRAFT_311465 [Lentinus tigrinus ALCF2SS1-7]
MECAHRISSTSARWRVKDSGKPPHCVAFPASRTIGSHGTPLLPPISIRSWSCICNTNPTPLPAGSPFDTCQSSILSGDWSFNAPRRQLPERFFSSRRTPYNFLSHSLTNTTYSLPSDQATRLAASSDLSST